MCLAQPTPFSNSAPTERDEVQECSTIESIGIVGKGVETTGVTALVQEACEQISVLGAHYVKPKLDNVQPDLQDLKEYFRRPRLIRSGDLPSGMNTNVFNITMSGNTIFSVYFPLGLERLTGVWGCRFKMVFTLQVAANPFHQGVVTLAYQPMNFGNMFNRLQYSAMVTNLPHVRCDISQTTMVQLEVPFIFNLEFLRLREGTLPILGTLGLNTLMHVRTPAGTSSPTYKLLMHLEELELIGVYPEGVSNVGLNAGRKLKPMNEEFENEAYPFSSSVSALSRSVRWLGRGIPAISSIAGPTSWFLEKTSGAIRSFGFSKPQIQEPQHRMVPMATALELNTDVSSATALVGPLANNQLKVDPDFAMTDVDEMSIAYILSQWSQIYKSDMRTADSVDTLLYATGISPSSFWFRETTIPVSGNYGPPLNSLGAHNSFIPSHQFFLAQMFRVWRGGFKFRFTFAKTKMHGGRVLCTYFPSIAFNTYTNAAPTVSVPTSPGGLPQPFTNSAIFDLRDNNVFEFDVPYLPDAPFTPFLGLTGYLALRVLDPLQAPSVVSDTIQYMVEVRASDGFELAIPCGVRYPCHTRGTPRLQAGRLLDAVDDSTSALTIGESINSVKQLIMIPKLSKATTVAGNEEMNVMPFFYHPLISPTVPGPTALPAESFSYGGNIAKCYVWARGSTDFHLYSSDPTSIYVASASSADGNNVVGSSSNNVFNASDSNLASVVESRNGYLHTRFPAYQRFVRINASSLDNFDYSARMDDPAGLESVFNVPDSVGLPVLPKVSRLPGTVSVANCICSRAAGDDAMLGMYIGPTPLVLTFAAATDVYDPDTPVAFP